jgi:hypothetical protein
VIWTPLFFVILGVGIAIQLVGVIGYVRAQHRRSKADADELHSRPSARIAAREAGEDWQRLPLTVSDTDCPVGDFSFEWWWSCAALAGGLVTAGRWALGGFSIEDCLLFAGTAALTGACTGYLWFHNLRPSWAQVAGWAATAVMVATWISLARLQR